MPGVPVCQYRWDPARHVLAGRDGQQEQPGGCRALSLCPHVLVSLTHHCSRKYINKKWGAGTEQGSGVSSFSRAGGAPGGPGWHWVPDPAARMGWERQTWRSLEIRLRGRGSCDVESAAPASPERPGAVRSRRPCPGATPGPRARRGQAPPASAWETSAEASPGCSQVPGGSGSSSGGTAILQGRERPRPRANCTALAPPPPAGASPARGSPCATAEPPARGVGAPSSLTLLLAVCSDTHLVASRFKQLFLRTAECTHPFSTGGCCDPGDPAVTLGIQLWLCQYSCGFAHADVRPCPGWSQPRAAPAVPDEASSPPGK